MASPPTSSLVFRSATGEPLVEPGEWSPCFVELPASSDALTDVVAERNEVPLTVVVRELAGAVRLLAEWPRSGTGGYRVRVTCGPETIADATVVVRPAKLSEKSYSKLLEDLELG